MPFGGVGQLSAYCADIVFCIDVTGSMSDAIQEVKNLASDFGTKVQESLESLDPPKSVDQLRVRVVAFRDFGSDRDALVSSPFFTMPDDIAAFQNYVDGLTAAGGGDAPENALEALAEAMNSDWTDEGSKQRHIIVLFTDAPAIPLEASVKSHPQYPAQAPANLAGLQDWWENGTPNGLLKDGAKRLILFVPEAEPWSAIKTWNQTEYGEPVAAGKGCAEATMDAILALIAKSFGAGGDQGVQA